MALAFLFKDNIFFENKQDRLFRFSVHPEVLFFDDGLFTYQIFKDDSDSIKTKIPVKLIRSAITTPIGEMGSKTEDFILSADLAIGLNKLNEKSYTTANEEAKKTKDSCRKFFDNNEKFLALGLKNLVREEAGMIKFCARYFLDSV